MFYSVLCYILYLFATKSDIYVGIGCNKYVILSYEEMEGLDSRLSDQVCLNILIFTL